MQCPRCKLTNPDSALRCDCGYLFKEGDALRADERMVLVGVDISWGDLFGFCLKLALCAIPAIWIAVLAYRLPGIIFDLLGAAAVLNASQK